MAGSQKEGYDLLVDEVERLGAEINALRNERSSLSHTADPEVVANIRKLDEWILTQEVVRRNIEVLVSIKKSGNFMNDTSKDIESKIKEGIRALKFSFE